jgi:hypothetical protein
LRSILKPFGVLHRAIPANAATGLLAANFLNKGHIMSLILTLEDLRHFLRCSGVKAIRIHQVGEGHLRVFVNMHVSYRNMISYIQFIIDRKKPAGIIIEIVEVEEFLTTDRGF